MQVPAGAVVFIDGNRVEPADGHVDLPSDDRHHHLAITY